jgi:predicted nuclease of predicted toxin-antitoxin system
MKICLIGLLIVDLYFDSVHVKTLGLINIDDVVICEYAEIHDSVIASTWEYYFSA